MTRRRRLPATAATPWATHFGAVVAESGGNKITLENYGRKHVEGSNLLNETIYYFRCMGLHPPVVNRGTRRGMPG